MATLPPVIRDARPDDLDVIVDFNARLAGDRGEGPRPRRPRPRGRRRPRRSRPAPLLGRRGGSRPVVGQAAVTREWSDWRDGWIWWFQSVYVHPDHRGRGAFRALHAAIRSAARAEPDVIGLRLYVEVHNDRAQRSITRSA